MIASLIKRSSVLHEQLVIITERSCQLSPILFSCLDGLENDRSGYTLNDQTGNSL